MQITDSHCHVSPTWYEPVETLLFQMDRVGVERAVLIQIMGQADNRYQFECVRRYPDRLVSVVIVDVASPDAPQALQRLAGEGASGVRLSAGARSPGDDPLLIWREAARLGLPISCGGDSQAFASSEFEALVQALPEASIVIEHLGGLNRPEGGEDWHERRRRVFALARYPNTFIKVPGLGEFCQRAMPVKEPFPFVEPIPPLLEEAYAAFGPDRMMWGSDYPPVSSREGYANALRFPREQFAGKSRTDQQNIFADTAWRVFAPRQ